MHPKRAVAAILLLSAAVGFSGCVAVAATGAAVNVAGATVGAMAKGAGMVVGAMIPDGEDEDR